MKVYRIDVIVTDDIAYAINGRTCYENAARVLLKKKLRRLVDRLVDDSALIESQSEYGRRRYSLSIGIDKKEVAT